jgi:hypothetical protein
MPLVEKENHPEKASEQFWLELAEGSGATNINFPFIEWFYLVIS